MMWWYGGGSSAMSLTMVAFWGLLAGLTYGVLRGLLSHRPPADGGRPDAQRLLDERLARGEIDEEQYARRRDLLDRRP
jgi:putative membrane protein